MPLKTKKQKTPSKKADLKIKSPKNVNSDFSEDVELSVANLPEPNN